MLFRVLFGIDALAALVLVYFFAIGIADGSVSSFNSGLWLATLAALAAILGGGAALRARGNTRAAIVVLLILAVPAIIFALFALSMIVLQPRWN
jgi:hypothetical protein